MREHLLAQQWPLGDRPLPSSQGNMGAFFCRLVGLLGDKQPYHFAIAKQTATEKDALKEYPYYPTKSILRLLFSVLGKRHAVKLVSLPA